MTTCSSMLALQHWQELTGLLPTDCRVVNQLFTQAICYMALSAQCKVAVLVKSP